ncbi:MAG TPA: hypothetical protein VJ818_05490 [Actinomycetota bacterium]|nr:hypothetical protein [Actinomycetota bacterium]
MTQTMIVILVVAVVVLIVIGLIAAAMSRRSRLRELPAESKDRFARSWDGIETRFIEDPRGAVQEADRVAVMVLTERGATMHDARSVPDDLRQARDYAQSDEGRGGTEGMRKAMVHYKRIVDDAVGGDRLRKDKDTDYRREVAS